MQRFNSERHQFGKLGEEEILPILEVLLGENLTPTEKLYDVFDAESESYWIELKTRTAKYHWSDKCMKEGWLIPKCKIDRALKEKKKTNFYYYWTSDKSLWELEFNPEILEGLICKIPWFHADKQPHYYFPQELWTEIQIISS